MVSHKSCTVSERDKKPLSKPGWASTPMVLFKKRDTIITNLLLKWFRPVLKVVALGLGQPSLQASGNWEGEMRWFYLCYGIQRTLVQFWTPGEKKTGVLPFLQRESCYDAVSQRVGSSWLLSAGLVGEVICCCSASDENICPWGTELYLRPSWPRISNNSQKACGNSSI